MTEHLQCKLAAILHADVVGYSRLMGEDELGTLARLKAHRKEFIDPTIASHHGRMVKLMGDGALIEFASVVDALACAVDIQRGMVERNQNESTERRIELRIGINLGDVIIDGDDIYGDGINVAARLESLADRGGVCISESVRSAIGNRLPFDYESMGEQEVKNILERLSPRDVDTWLGEAYLALLQASFAEGDFEEAKKSGVLAIQMGPKAPIRRALMIAICAYTGDSKGVAHHAAELNAFAPDFIPSILSGAMTLYKMPEHNALLVDGLRKAGFAE